MPGTITPEWLPLDAVKPTALPRSSTTEMCVVPWSDGIAEAAATGRPSSARSTLRRPSSTASGASAWPARPPRCSRRANSGPRSRAAARIVSASARRAGADPGSPAGRAAASTASM